MSLGDPFLGNIIPTCAGAGMGPPLQSGDPHASFGRWPASLSAASSVQTPPPPVTGCCGDGWPCSDRHQSGSVPVTARWTPTRGPASGPAG